MQGGEGFQSASRCVRCKLWVFLDDAMQMMVRMRRRRRRRKMISADEVPGYLYRVIG